METPLPPYSTPRDAIHANDVTSAPKSRMALLAGIGVLSFGVSVAALIYWQPGAPTSSRRAGPASTMPADVDARLFSLSPGSQADLVTPRPASPGNDVPRCATNLQHLAAGLQAWANRHDWQLPERLDQLASSDFVEPRDLICPADISGTSSAGSSYVYTGRGLKTPVDPRTIVAYEPARHLSGAGLHTLMGDGSVKLLTGDDAKKLLAAAQTGRLPLQMPSDPSDAQAADALHS